MTELSIKDRTVLGIRDEVAAQLIKNWERVAIAAGADGKKAPSKDDAQRMADGLIAHREFEYNGKKVSFEGLKSKFEPIAKFSPEVKSLLNDFKVVDQIPTKDQAEQIGEAVERGVKKGSSGFTSIWNYISGFIEWAVQAIQHFFDKSKPYKSLQECIGGCFARSTSSAVAHELNELGKNDPRIGKILTHERKEQIANTVHAGAIAEAKGEKLNTPNPLDTARPEAGAVLDHVAVKKAVKETISSVVDAKFKQNLKGHDFSVEEGLKKWRAVGGYGFDDKQVEAVKTAVKETFEEVIYTQGKDAINKLDDAGMKQAILGRLSKKLETHSDNKIKSQAKDFVKAMGESIDNDTLKMVKETNVAMEEAQRLIAEQAKIKLMQMASDAKDKALKIGDGLKEMGSKNLTNIPTPPASLPLQTNTVAMQQSTTPSKSP